MNGGFFGGLFETPLIYSRVEIGDFVLCLVTALVIGAVLAGSYMFRARYTKSFAVTLALLPAVVSVVIMMVNGNIGAGVAVAGTFSLVRFRSVPGTAREILAIFLAMGAGLVVGMGYLGFAAVFTLIMAIMLIITNFVKIDGGKNEKLDKTLKITIPEDLDYTEAFSDIFEEYTSKHELVRVKTANMGSMFRLTYDITFVSEANEKAFIDALRTRNGNLEIMISKRETLITEL